LLDLRNKKVLVVGLGSSGMACAELLHEEGAIVFATDSGDGQEVREHAGMLKKKDIETETGRHTEGFIRQAELMVLSPGVPRDGFPVKYALDNAIPVISEIELGFQFCKAPIVAITGTNGKSTVVTLLGKVFRAAGKDHVVLGNIGTPFCSGVKALKKKSVCILEVSSFQLEWIVDFKPHISCILNVTDDHLERYRGFDDYVEAKLKICANQGKNDHLVLNYDDKKLRTVKIKSKVKPFYYSRKEVVEGVFIKNKNVILKNADMDKTIARLDKISLPGDHNIENILAVIAMSNLMGIGKGPILKAIEGYRPLSHRIETITIINGIEFIDDSKATNVDAAKRAIESINKRIVLIAGGRDKGGNYALVESSLVEKVKKMVIIGEAAPILEKAFENKVPMEKCDSLQAATRRAFEIADAGEAVLLSPMCSSFDMFKDYKERGSVFQRTIIQIKNKAGS